jgi:hypothetical protein
MKNIIITILLGTTILFGALYFRQTQNATANKNATAALQQQVTNLQATVESQERRTTMLRQDLDKARAQTTTKLREAVQQNKKSGSGGTAADSPKTAGSKMGNAMAGMAEQMKNNPELREMIKNQQKIALSGMTDKNYAKLFTQLHLTPEQSATLKDLIVSKQMAGAEMGMSMLSDDVTPEKRAELVKQVKTTTDDADAKIKEFLGDSNYTDFQTYEKSLGERMAITGFKDQLGAANGLSDSQESELLKAMSQERGNFKFTTDYSDKSKLNNSDWGTMFSDDKVNTFMQEMGQLNQQYITRAQSILTADQLTSFQKYLDGQTALQKAGMQMAAKMFGGNAEKK